MGCEPAAPRPVPWSQATPCDEGVIAPSGPCRAGIWTGHQLKDLTATVAYHSKPRIRRSSRPGPRQPGRPDERGSRTGRTAVANDLDDIIRGRPPSTRKPNRRADILKKDIGISVSIDSLDWASMVRTGRMGTRLIQPLLWRTSSSLKLGAALVREGHTPTSVKTLAERAGAGEGGRSCFPRLCRMWTVVDVMIDFSLPLAVPAITESCRTRKIPLVVGTTGLGPAERHALEHAATDIPILIAPNMSRAVNLLMKLVREAARSLGDSADIAIIESASQRPRKTLPAPDGPLRLADCAGQGHRHGRLVPGDAGLEERPGPREITIHALRIADCPGEHTVVFGVPGETLELAHRALNRDGFVRGALDCAKFLAAKSAGLYTMEDVLGC